jgi:hypothetical protein
VIVLGLLLAALGAVYQFILENAAAITVFGVVTGSLLLLAYFFSKIGTRKTVAASAPPALPRSAARLAPGPTTPRVEARDHFGFRQAPTAGPAAGSLSSIDAEVGAMMVLQYQLCRARHCCFEDIRCSHLQLDRAVGLPVGSRPLLLVALPASGVESQSRVSKSDRQPQGMEACFA